MEPDELLSAAIAFAKTVYGPERTTGEIINDVANYYATDYPCYMFLSDALTAFFSIAY
jgi:hypothetical protein